MKSPFSLVASTRSKAQVVFSKVKMTVPVVMVRQSQADVGLRTQGSSGGSDGKAGVAATVIKVGVAIVIRPHLRRGICAYSISTKGQASDLGPSRSGSPLGGVVTNKQTRL